jgi:hypothetical protein
VALYKQFENSFLLLQLTPPIAQKQVMIEGDVRLRTLSWTQDGKGFFVSSAVQQGAQLLYVDVKGKTHFLYQLRGQNAFLWAKPSPDGRRIALLEGAFTANVWLLKNF